MFHNNRSPIITWKKLSLWFTALLLMVVVSACGQSGQEVALSKQAPPRRGAVDVLAQVQEITAESLGVSEDAVVEDADFRQDLGADEAKMAQLGKDFGEAFSVKLTDEEIKELTTVRSAVTLIESKQK